MKKLFSLIALTLMIATPALAWRGGWGVGVGVGGPGWGVGFGGPGYYGGWGYPGWYGGWGYPGWGYDPDPVATEEARQMRADRKERERQARDRRKAQRRGEYYPEQTPQGSQKPHNGATPRSKEQIEAEKRRLSDRQKELDAEYRAAAAA